MISRDQIDKIHQNIRLSSIVGDIVHLKPAGVEMVGLCPFHEEKTPSFYVNDTKGLYNCFGCGAAGDGISFVQHAYNLSFLEAVSWLADQEHIPLDPVEKAAATERDRSDYVAAIREARVQWNRSVPTAGTAADLYLQSRRIHTPPPPAIRYVVAPLRKGEETSGKGRRLPAMIAAAVDRIGRLMAVHRVFLTATGQKAGLSHPKLSLGAIDGCAVRLGGVDAEIIVCEGLEDGLTLSQRFGETPVWVPLGTGNMHKLQFPDTVRRITIAADNDAPGLTAAERAREKYEADGLQVAIVQPPLQFKDWNDELCNKPIEAD